MKCDVLKVYEDIDDYIGYDDTPPMMYEKSEVDAAIAELKRENERLVKCCKEYDSRQRIDERIKFNGSQQLRATKRALWLARAERAKAIKWHEGLERYLQERKKYWPSRFSFMKDDEMYHLWYKCWCKVERKCLAKAEGYK